MLLIPLALPNVLLIDLELCHCTENKEEKIEDKAVLSNRQSTFFILTQK